MSKIASIREERENKRVFFFKSGIPFVKNHYGFRPGKMHMVLSRTSGGKSTLMRTLIADVLKFNPTKKIGVILSEETETEFFVELTEGRTDLESQVEKISCLEELALRKFSIDEYLQKMQSFIVENEIDICFYDNITTSYFYDNRPPKEQSDYVSIIKSLTKKLNIPMVSIAHTSSSITAETKRLIGPEDVRGNKAIANLMEFVYVMQVFVVRDTPAQYIQVPKKRGYDLGGLYRLIYNSKTKTFSNVLKIDFEEMKESYNNREKLN